MDNARSSDGNECVKKALQKTLTTLLRIGNICAKICLCCSETELIFDSGGKAPRPSATGPKGRNLAMPRIKAANRESAES